MYIGYWTLNNYYYYSIIKQHRSKGAKPNDTPFANNHCCTRYEQSFRHKKIRKLHQGTQILHNILKSHILTTSIQNWRSTGWRPFTYTIQNLHCRHTTTQSTCPGHGLQGWRHHHIYTHNPECSKEIHTTIPTKSFCLDKIKQLTLNQDKTTCTLFTPDTAEYKCNLALKINNTALPMATHPSYGHYLRPKPHIQHAHSQHLSTSTHATTNDQSTHRNRMG